MPSGHQKIGEFLVDLGVISPIHLSAALADQRTFGGRLGSHLVRMGCLSEERLIEAATKQMRILPYYHSFASKSHLPMIDLAERLKKLEERIGYVEAHARRGVEAFRERLLANEREALIGSAGPIIRILSRGRTISCPAPFFKITTSPCTSCTVASK